MRTDIEAFVGLINLDHQVIVVQTDDAGKSRILDRIALPFDCSFTTLEEVLEQEGYEILRYEDGCSENAIIVILASQTYGLADDPPTSDPIDSEFWPGDGEGGCGGYST